VPRPWAISDGPEDATLLLRNSSSTLIRFSQNVSPDVERLMHDMKLADVPFSFTEGLSEIYFTVLKQVDGEIVAGDYIDGRIRLSCGRHQIPLHHVLVHELGHHVDEIEGISSRPKVMDEKRRRAHRLGRDQATEDVAEYIAIGFEVFYFGGRGAKAQLMRDNPRLYNVLRYIHRKYQDR
jgi:hypothetical protein